ACVPGGVYWMSDPLHTLGTSLGFPPERVVVIRSFWIDVHEVTVADLRRSGIASSDDPPRSSGSTDDCTYTDASGSNDKLPVTCLSWNLASRYCAKRGRRLLSEAEFEVVAGGGRYDRYVWGSDDPSCADIVAARVDPSTLTATDSSTKAQCSSLGLGPSAPGTGRRDVLVLGDARVLDVAGNVGEWTRDKSAE